MTMDTYGHLFEDRLDEVAEALDAGRAASRTTTATTPTDATVIDLMTRRRDPSGPMHGG